MAKKETFLEELKELVETGQLKEPFTVVDVRAITSNPEANNLSNYAIQNEGSSNKNNKVLHQHRNKEGKYEYHF